MTPPLGFDILRVLAAAHEVCETLGNNADLGLAQGLTCHQAIAIAELMDTCGLSQLAAAFIEAHSWGDDEPTDEHHDAYLRLSGHA